MGLFKGTSGTNKRKDSVPVENIDGLYSDRVQRTYLHKKGPRHQKRRKK